MVLGGKAEAEKNVNADSSELGDTFHSSFVNFPVLCLPYRFHLFFEKKKKKRKARFPKKLRKKIKNEMNGGGGGRGRQGGCITLSDKPARSVPKGIEFTQLLHI